MQGLFQKFSSLLRRNPCSIRAKALSDIIQQNFSNFVMYLLNFARRLSVRNDPDGLYYWSFLSYSVNTNFNTFADAFSHNPAQRKYTRYTSLEVISVGLRQRTALPINHKTNSLNAQLLQMLLDATYVVAYLKIQKNVTQIGNYVSR